MNADDMTSKKSSIHDNDIVDLFFLHVVDADLDISHDNYIYKLF